MKTSTFLTVLLAGSSVQAGALLPPKVNKTDPEPWKYSHLKSRQMLGYFTTIIGKGGKVAEPLAAKGVAKKQVLRSTSEVPGVRRIKFRYGPYEVPNMNRHGITGEAGSLWNYPDTNIEKPCSVCTIVSQQAGLEFPNGDNANVDHGMWLHHMVHFLKGPGRWDPTCYGRPFSLPHFDVGATPQSAERYFSSGNERTRFKIDYAGAATNAGYHVKSTDSMAFIVDLMNMNMDDKIVYVTMTYDIVDGPLPAGWRDIRTVWFDANQCGTSEVHPPKQSGQFTITSSSWTPNFNGEVLGVSGHLHDGGTNVVIMTNNQINCNSVAAYAEKPEFKSKKMSMGASAGMAEEHISSMTACYGPEIKTRKLSSTQSWKILGKYDYSNHPGNKEGSKQASIMSISLMFVAIDPKK
jgi:hypothetical protein